MALVLTFELAADEAKRIDVALREPAKSRLDHPGKQFSMRTAQEVKRERIRNIRDQIIRRCVEWLKTRMPGTLSTAKEGSAPLTCALFSLAVGKPFATQDDYMELLDLRFQYFVQEPVDREFLFLVNLLEESTKGCMIAAFNEADAVRGRWLFELYAAPSS